jgi:hypothetical protein
MKKVLAFLSFVFFSLTVAFSSALATDSETPPTPYVTTGIQISEAVSINPGWNLISVPLQTTDSFNLQELLGGKSTIAWKFIVSDTGVYQWEQWLPGDTQKTLNVGEGLFVGVPSSYGTNSLIFTGNASLNYIPFEEKSFLTGKWYLVGYPYDMTVGEIKALYPNSAVWIMENGNYRKLDGSTTMITKGQGFWFKTYGAKVTSSSSSSSSSSSNASVSSSSSSSSLSSSSSSSSAANPSNLLVADSYIQNTGTASISITNLIVRMTGALVMDGESGTVDITVNFGTGIVSGSVCSDIEGCYDAYEQIGVSYFPITLIQNQIMALPDVLNWDDEDTSGSLTYVFTFYTSSGSIQKTIIVNL